MCPETKTWNFIVVICIWDVDSTKKVKVVPEFKQCKSNRSSVTTSMLSKMDMTSSPPPSTIFCRFCHAVISFRTGTVDKFKAHMETVPEIHMDFEFLLSIHFVKEEEKSNVV